MKKHIFIMIFFVLQLSAFAQNRYTKVADDAFQSGEYFDASELYLSAYAKVNDKIMRAQICFQLGECYRFMSKPKDAELWYKRAIQDNYQDSHAFLYYADALKMNGLYDKALIQYEEYLKLVPNDERGTIGVTSCEEAAKWLQSPTRHIVTIVNDLNSEQSDFAPRYAKEDYTQLLFTSTREASSGNEFNAVSGQNSADIFFTLIDNKGKWSEAVPIYGAVNSRIDEGASFFSFATNTLYFTRCDRDKRKDMGCRIFTAQKNDTVWENIQAIPFEADTSVSFGHPALTPDGLTIYFVSDKEGGLGGKDIWYMQRTSLSASWSNPTNLGATINTAGDEMFPYSRNNNELYFSSNYHAGMGGLDIFVAKRENNSWKVENMKFPINSSFDDFGFVIENETEKGYFSSSRGNDLQEDNIYSFLLPQLKFTLQGVVKNSETGNIVKDATVKVEASNGELFEFKTDENGEFKMTLSAETDYFFVASKENFLNGKTEETTKGLLEDKNLQVEMLIIPIQETIELPNIEYDLGKWDLRPESMVSLDKLVKTLEDNPRIVIELGSHTDFRGSDQSNETLSQNRAQSVVNYLISMGIASERLQAKGYGEYKPKTVDAKTAQKYSFLKENDVLNEEFINKLADDTQKEIAHQLNRRTEFRVLSSNYIPE